MKRSLNAFAAIALSFAASAHADAPDKSFLRFDGQMYGSANQGQPAHHGHQVITVKIPAGTIVDAAYGQGNIGCCGGDDNGNGASTAVPSGVYLEIGGGNAGEWGVFNIVRDTIVDDDTGEIKGYKLSADTYCGPSAIHGGCNVHVYGWIKLKPRAH
jgi:hypothetical protein